MTAELIWYRVRDTMGGAYHVQAWDASDAVARAIAAGWCRRSDEARAERVNG